MRDAIFILFVALILLGITAIKYRKQIAGMIGVARMLKEAAQPRSGGTCDGAVPHRRTTTR